MKMCCPMTVGGRLGCATYVACAVRNYAAYAAV